MTRTRGFSAATALVVGLLGCAGAALAVTPGQTTGQAASSTGSQPGAQPGVTEVGKASGCTTTGGATPESGAWTGEQNEPRSGQAAAGCPATEAQPGGGQPKQ